MGQQARAGAWLSRRRHVQCSALRAGGASAIYAFTSGSFDSYIAASCRHAAQLDMHGDGHAGAPAARVLIGLRSRRGVPQEAQAGAVQRIAGRARQRERRDRRHDAQRRDLAVQPGAVDGHQLRRHVRRRDPVRARSILQRQNTSA